MNCIGIDIGATYIKSALLDLDAGKVTYRHCVAFPPFLPSDEGKKEVRITAVRDAVSETIEWHRKREWINTFALCGQMGGFMDEGVFGRFVSWQDKRCDIDDRNCSPIAYAVCLRLGIKPLFPTVGDHQCALLGAGLQPGELSLNIATGSQVSVITSGIEDGPHQTRNYFDGQFLKCKTHIPAGRALNGILRLVREMSGMGEDMAWDYVIEAVSGRKYTDLRWNLKFWPSEVGPEGKLLGILEDNLNVGDLFLAAFQAMARNYFEVAKRLGAEKLPIVFSGGLVRRLDKLRDAILAEFNPPSWRMAADPDETLAGLLELARKEVGR